MHWYAKTEVPKDYLRRGADMSMPARRVQSAVVCLAATAPQTLHQSRQRSSRPRQSPRPFPDNRPAHREICHSLGGRIVNKKSRSRDGNSRG